MPQVQFIQTTPEQLQEAILSGVKIELEKLHKNFQPKEPEEYLTRAEVAEMLKIDLKTVDNYSKKGILQKRGIGKRVYFRRSEIESSIIQL